MWIKSDSLLETLHFGRSAHKLTNLIQLETAKTSCTVWYTSGEYRRISNHTQPRRRVHHSLHFSGHLWGWRRASLLPSFNLRCRSFLSFSRDELLSHHSVGCIEPKLVRMLTVLSIHCERQQNVYTIAPVRYRNGTFFVYLERFVSDSRDVGSVVAREIVITGERHTYHTHTISERSFRGELSAILLTCL